MLHAWIRGRAVGADDIITHCGFGSTSPKSRSRYVVAAEATEKERCGPRPERAIGPDRSLLLG